MKPAYRPCSVCLYYNDYYCSTTKKVVEPTQFGCDINVIIDDIQPRYIAYAKSRGIEIKQLLQADHQADYIVWLNGKLAQWKAAHNKPANYSLAEKDHEEFTTWLMDFDAQA